MNAWRSRPACVPLPNVAHAWVVSRHDIKTNDAWGSLVRLLMCVCSLSGVIDRYRRVGEGTTLAVAPCLSQEKGP